MVHVVIEIQGFSHDNLVKTCKMNFSEYDLSSKIDSVVGTNFISKIFKEFCK